MYNVTNCERKHAWTSQPIGLDIPVLKTSPRALHLTSVEPSWATTLNSTSALPPDLADEAAGLALVELELASTTVSTPSSSAMACTPKKNKTTTRLTRLDSRFSRF